jgi:hypothetical protein
MYGRIKPFPVLKRTTFFGAHGLEVVALFISAIGAIAICAVREGTTRLAYSAALAGRRTWITRVSQMLALLAWAKP